MVNVHTHTHTHTHTHIYTHIHTHTHTHTHTRVYRSDYIIIVKSQMFGAGKKFRNQLVER